MSMAPESSIHQNVNPEKLGTYPSDNEPKAETDMGILK